MKQVIIEPIANLETNGCADFTLLLDF